MKLEPSHNMPTIKQGNQNTAETLIKLFPQQTENECTRNL